MRIHSPRRQCCPTPLPAVTRPSFARATTSRQQPKGGRQCGESRPEQSQRERTKQARRDGRSPRGSGTYGVDCASVTPIRQKGPRKRMPARARSSTALQEIARLRAQVSSLGAALGRVISRLEGRRAFEMVEKLRRLAKARRMGDRAAEKKLSAAIASLSTGAAFNQAMAFTLYFELVNLAEENFRISILRRRRAEQLSEAGQAKDSPRRESIEAALVALKEQGVGGSDMQSLLDRLQIELVFTAHPTESKRRTLLTKLRRLGELLRERAHPEFVRTAAVL